MSHLIFSNNDQETITCKLESCSRPFQRNYKGRKREFCSHICKQKYYRVTQMIKSKEYDFERFRLKKVTQLLTPQAKKKAESWGLLN